MKRIFYMIAFVAIALGGLQSCDEDTQINPSELPKTAETFINTHFAEASVNSVMKDFDDFTIHYDVYLSDGTFIEFNKNGEWKEVENRVTGVPASVIPEAIQTYVTTNYSDAFVVDIERDRQYDVELNTGIELDFDLSGKFLRFDY